MKQDHLYSSEDWQRAKVEVTTTKHSNLTKNRRQDGTGLRKTSLGVTGSSQLQHQGQLPPLSYDPEWW